jgi:hypothetical protein
MPTKISVNASTGAVEEVEMEGEELAAHEITILPGPLRYEQAFPISATIQTTNDTPTEIYRFACEEHRQYTAELTFMGVNPSNWATKSTGMRYAFKRVAGGTLFVGEAPIFNIDEQGSAAWDISVAFQGNDFIVYVIGGRTHSVDWLVAGPIQVYVPAGF